MVRLKNKDIHGREITEEEHLNRYERCMKFYFKSQPDSAVLYTYKKCLIKKEILEAEVKKRGLKHGS